MKALVGRLCGIIVGLVMLGAGLLKLMDPVGDSLVVETYLQILGLGWAAGLSGLIGWVLSFLEAALGIALVFGLFRKTASIVASALLAGFTVLTVWLWSSGSQMSCGCFGEAVPMSAAQSTIKNAGLLVLMCGYAFLAEPRALFKPAYMLVAAVVSFSIYSVIELPLVDFTPMKEGSNVSGSFDEVPMEGSVAVISFYKTDSEIPEGFFSAMVRKGYRPVVIASYGSCPASDCLDEDSVYYADRRSVLTLNRRNGGVTLLEDGVVVEKMARFRRP